MEYKLPCAIVRDLLPAYAENLTEKETSEAVAAHLKECSDCRRQLEKMSVPLTESIPEAAHEVDFLKSVRKHNRVRIVLAIGLVIAVLAAALLLHVFVIGSSTSIYGVCTDAVMDKEHQLLHLEIASVNSAEAFCGWKTTVEDGILSISSRKVLVSPIHSSGFHTEIIDVSGLRQINLFDSVIWKNGIFLKDNTKRMFDSRVQYVGDAPAIGALSGALPLPQIPFTQALQTNSEPYGWTVCFKETLSLTERNQIRKTAPLALTLVNNMGVFSWSYPDENGTPITESVTLEEINAQLPEKLEEFNLRTGQNIPLNASVKDFAQDAFSLQLLCDLFGI